MIQSLLRYLCGTYKIKLEGAGLEKFLSKIINTNYKIWNIQKNSDTLTFDCYAKSYEKIIKYADGINSQIVCHKGLPTVARKYKNRYGLLIGAVLFSIVFYIFTLFVWEINVVGCDKTSPQEILTRLDANGFKIGVLKKPLKLKSIENSFLTGFDKVSWISINIKGTTATVEIREKEKKPELIDSSQPCSIYASRDGVIASVNAYMGYSVVNEGDTVSAGDLIVSGNYTDKYGVEYKLHSYASVKAYTTHSHSVTVPFKTYQQQKTGKYKKFHKINLIRFSIPLYFNKKISYNKYSINRSFKKFSLGGGFVFPFWIETLTYTKTQEICYEKSKQAALMDAYEELSDYEANLVGIVVNGRDYEVTETPDAVTVKVLLDCYEDIGIKKKID